MKLLLGMGLLSILLLGCIDIEYNQDVDRSGNSVITEKINFTALIEASKEQNQTPPDYSSICINATKGRSDIYCAYEDGVVTVRKNFTEDDGNYVFEKSSEFPNIVYTLEVRRLPDLGNTDDLGQTDTSADFKSAEARNSAATLRAVAVKITYVVSMPGEIYSAENGKMVDGAAEFDVLERMSEGEYIVVKSRELDIVPLAAIGLAILIAGGLVVFFLKKK